MTRPNFFIIGTTKGGTSSLHLWLNQHPEISLSRPKELHQLCQCPNPALRVSSDWDDYLGHFADNFVTGESSPCYLYDAATAELLYEHFPDAKLLVSLRDPVERFWSHYLMNEVYRPTGLSAEDVLARNLKDGHSDALNDLFGMGLYGQQLCAFLARFQRGQIHVTFLESLESDPDTEVARIIRFLGLPEKRLSTDTQDKQYVEPRGSVGRFFLRNPRIRRLGVALLPPSIRRPLRTKWLGTTEGKPPMSPGLRDRLRDLYTEDSRLLEATLEGALPWDWHQRRTRFS